MKAEYHQGISAAFSPSLQRKDHYFADIYQLARLRLLCFGVSSVFGGDHCTYAEKEHFFSYRREKQTGRMVSLIYIKS